MRSHPYSIVRDNRTLTDESGKSITWEQFMVIHNETKDQIGVVKTEGEARKMRDWLNNQIDRGEQN